MLDVSFDQVAWLLAAAALAAPLAKLFRIGSVLGYLLAGILIGPYGIGQVFSNYKAREVLEFAEFGVVLLLFLIGLELRPLRLWSMRSAIFGLGGAQVGLTAVGLCALGMLFGLAPATAAFAALALSLSSTAFALQVLEEKGELTARHGRLAFAVLLFQDLAAIPLIALAPLFAATATGATAKMDLVSALIALLTIAGVVLVGHFLLDHVFRLIARASVKEAMAAAALLTVVGVSVVMQKAGIPASLGAFLAGALLAESSYRHQLQADIQPFEGLLLGVFFTAIGMQLNLDLLVSRPQLAFGLVILLLSVKAAVLYGLGRWHGLEVWPARRFAIAISQGGEFAFVLLTAGSAAGVLAGGDADLLAIVVTLSMAATPLLLLADDIGLPRRQDLAAAFVAPPPETGHVIIAGFGRFGQIIARILRAKRIPFTALDINPEQIALVERFGSKAFYGDASRPEVIEASQAAEARAFVLAIDDVEASIRAAQFVRSRYPKLPIYARARNRNHVHRLMDLGVNVIRRETFLSALDLTRELLRGLGLSERDVRFAVETFARHDRRRLREDYKHYTDREKMEELARSDTATLARLFDEDAAEQAKLAESSEQFAKPAKAKKELTA
jgi:glutathione-regulated potassium-efflux system protein KefB